MLLKRYEILLPLVYNDGKEIEPKKFDQTFRELVEKFDAVTIDSLIITGKWIYEGTLFNDQLIRIRVDIEDIVNNKVFMKDYKETLKMRFNQIDIWISSQDIEII